MATAKARRHPPTSRNPVPEDKIGNTYQPSFAIFIGEEGVHHSLGMEEEEEEELNVRCRLNVYAAEEEE